MSDNHDNYTEFFKKLLEKIDSSQGNEEEVYPILESNQHLLNEKFSHWLNQWTRYKITQLSSSDQKDLAILISRFGNLIREFPLGNSRENKEIAIKSHQLAVTVFNRENHPKDWAVN